MTFNITDVVEYQYPGQIALGNVMFRKPDEDILIAKWAIPNVPQPTEQSLIDFGNANERAIEINMAKIGCLVPVQNVIDATAQAKTYANGVACVSYASSTNTTWKAEADAFIAWRDSVWTYLYNLLAQISGGSDPIPTVDQIIAQLPQITWPD